MPYTLSKPPPAIRGLPREAQRIWIATYNDVYQKYGESRSFATAWSAVEQHFSKDSSGRWHRKERGILEALAMSMTNTKATKREGGEDYEMDAFLFHPDPEKPSEWKLRIEDSPGEVTVAQLGRAAAALGPGFRGQRVQLSPAERKAAATKLIALYHEMDVEDDDIPQYLFGIAGKTREKNYEVDFGKDLKILEVWDSFVIVEKAEGVYQVPYAEVQGGPEFSAADKWTEVEYAWAPVQKARLLWLSEPEEEATEGVVESEQALDNSGPVSAKDSETEGNSGGIRGAVEKVARALGLKREERWPEGQFVTVKQKDGRYRWVAVSSTAVEDRDGEVVSRDAMDAAVEKAWQGKEFGILDFWHTDLPLGSCDFMAREGLALVESGLWDATKAGEKAAQTVMAEPNKWAVSIKFLYDPQRTEKADGLTVYKAVELLSRAILPVGKEAARYTMIGSQEVSVNEEQKKALVGLVGDEAASELLKTAKAVEGKAAEANLVTKDATDFAEPAAPAAEVAVMPPDKTAEVLGLLQKLTEAVTALDGRMKAVEEKAATAPPDLGTVTRQALFGERASQSVETEVKEGEKVPPGPGKSFDILDAVAKAIAGGTA